MSATNPWLMRPEPAVATAVAASPVVEQVRVALRPLPRQHAREVLATVTRAEGPGLWLVGAHGGAGVSTLAALSGAYDAGTAWPATTGTASCLLVCRTNLAGVAAAQAALGQWAQGGAPQMVELLGLVLVADSPKKPPRAVSELVQVLAGPLPRLVQVAWSEPWRAERTPTHTSAPAPVRRTIRELADLARSLGAAHAAHLERNPE